MPDIVIAKFGSTAEDIARRLFCKTVMELRRYKGEQPFSESFAIELIISKVKFVTQVEYRVPGGTQKTKRVNISKEEAIRVWKGLIGNGYVTPSHRQMPDKLHPKIPREGILLWKIDSFRLTECEQLPWYKAATRKRKWRETAQSLDIQRCRALRHMYSIFGLSPFTYDMATGIGKYLRKVESTPGVELTTKDKEVIKSIIQSSEMSTNEFMRVWNSLIQNGYLIQHRKRTPKGIVRTNAYVINKSYLRRCMSAFEV
jgi:hypothetical protein